jgi:hypothetical protein
MFSNKKCPKCEKSYTILATTIYNVQWCFSHGEAPVFLDRTLCCGAPVGNFRGGDPSSTLVTST